MKSTFQLTATIVGMTMALTSFTIAIPTTKRSGVTCTKKYGEGQLHVTNLYGGKGSKPGEPDDQIGQTTDGNRYLSTDPKLQSVTFQFDQCEAEGFNSEGGLYGQVKYTDDSNTKCVTAIPSPDLFDDYSLLQIQECESYNGGNLINQWFKATPETSKELGDYIKLELTGQKSTAISTNVSQGIDLVNVLPINSPVPNYLALFKYTE